METSIRRTLDFVLYSNVFIGCCAAAQVALFYRLLSLPLRSDIITLVAVSTVVLYSIPQVRIGARAQGNAKLRWTHRNRKLFLSMFTLATAVLVVLLVNLRIPVIAGYVLAGVVALAYYAPLIGRSGRKEGFRSLYGAKVFYIAFVWVLACVCFPSLVAYITGQSVRWMPIVAVALWVFVFVAAITIPFDIRDQRGDRKHGLRTLPVLIGVRGSRCISVLLLGVHGLLVAMSAHGLYTRLLLLSVSIYAVVLVMHTKSGKGDYFHFLLVDGLLILQFVAVEAGSRLPL